MSDRRVLVVEDEENLLAALKYNLEREGYAVTTAADGPSGLDSARSVNHDLVILDIMLPGLDGLELCRAIRRESSVPIIMLTAKAEEVDRIVGLELGADDYVTKPFSMRELMARARAMLRRSRMGQDGPDGAAAPETIHAGDLVVDLTAHTAVLGDRTLELKPREFELLALLMSNRGRAFTRDQLLQRLWGQDYVGDSRTVDVHVRWLREKIESEPGKPKRIITIRGVGYRFER